MAANTQPQTGSVTCIEPDLICIPATSFLMGSNSGQECERPVHRISLNAFLIASTQVTNAQYSRFLQSTGTTPPPFWDDPGFKHPQQPVIGVSWLEADRYCQWLSLQNGRPYRLPTEAEWERAARGSFEQKDFPWGEDPPQSLPDYTARWLTGPEPVALYPPNSFGIYNLCENVHEWCSDWYDPDYYSISPEHNPPGPNCSPAIPPRKSSRGGSWRHHIKVSRCSARSSIPPHFQYADYGFRVACNPTQHSL